MTDDRWVVARTDRPTLDFAYNQKLTHDEAVRELDTAREALPEWQWCLIRQRDMEDDA